MLKKLNLTPAKIAILAFAVVFAVIIIFTFVLFGIFKDANSAPEFFGKRVYVMQTERMEPRIAKGSAVFVDEGAMPSAGNAVLCYIEEKFTVVGYVGAQEITTADGSVVTKHVVKYDVAQAGDKPLIIEQSDIIGRAVSYSTLFGGLISFASSKAGMLLIVILPCAAIVIYEIIMLALSISKKKVVKNVSKPLQDPEEFDYGPEQAEDFQEYQEIEPIGEYREPVYEEPISEPVYEQEPEPEEEPVQYNYYWHTEAEPQPEPVAEPEPVYEEPVREPVRFVAPEPVAEPEPIVEPEPVAEPEVEEQFTLDMESEPTPAPAPEIAPAYTAPEIVEPKLASTEKKPSDDVLSGISSMRIDELMKMLEEEKKRLTENK